MYYISFNRVSHKGPPTPPIERFYEALCTKDSAILSSQFFFSFYYFFIINAFFFSLTPTFNLLFCINTIKGPSLCRPAFPITTYTHTRYPYIIIFLLYERQFFYSLFFKSFLQRWRVPISVYQSTPTNSDVFSPFYYYYPFHGFFLRFTTFCPCAYLYSVPATCIHTHYTYYVFTRRQNKCAYTFKAYTKRLKKNRIIAIY